MARWTMPRWTARVGTSCCSPSRSPNTSTPIPVTCREVNVSGWLLPRPCITTRRSCWLMIRRRPWTPRRTSTWPRSLLIRLIPAVNAPSWGPRRASRRSLRPGTEDGRRGADRDHKPRAEERCLRSGPVRGGDRTLAAGSCQVPVGPALRWSRAWCQTVQYSEDHATRPRW